MRGHRFGARNVNHSEPLGKFGVVSVTASPRARLVTELIVTKELDQGRSHGH